MKRFIYVLVGSFLLIFLGTTGLFAGNFSNIERGTFEISGDLDLSLSSLDLEIGGVQTSDTDTTTTDTSFLYYIAPNLGVGLGLFLENSKTTSVGFSSEVRTTLIGPQVGARIVLSDSANLRLSGGLSFVDVEVTDSTGGSFAADGFGIALGVGVSYFPVQSVSFNGGLSYSSLSTDDEATNTSIDTDGISLGVGLSVYIR